MTTMGNGEDGSDEKARMFALKAVVDGSIQS